MIRFLKRWLVPDSLMARMQVLVILPILVIISLNTFIFFERHWHEVQLVLVRSVVRELAHVINYPAPLSMEWRELVAESLDLDITFTPDATLPEQRRLSDSTTDALIAAQMRTWIQYDFDVDTRQPGKRVYFWIELPSGVMQVEAHRKRVESFTIDLMIGFVLFSAALFSLLAAFFMRKQVQPILALTRHVEQNELPILKAKSPARIPTFDYSGAGEIRSLTRAFAEFHNKQLTIMRERSEMLHGISHDLRTPLTRMKLQLELLEQNADTETLLREVGLMKEMLDSYLDFMAHNSREEPQPITVAAVIRTMQEDWRHEASRLEFPDDETLKKFADNAVKVFMRPQLLRRALDNVLGNALRYGTHCQIAVIVVGKQTHFIFNDNGPGIPQAERDKVLMPFYRLDSARRSDTGGSGLGLALVRETMIMHDAGIELADAPQGGLQVTLRLPVV